MVVISYVALLFANDMISMLTASYRLGQQSFLSNRSSQTNNQPVLLTFTNEGTGCSGDETKVTVEVKADRFSNDTSWELIDYYSGKKFLSQRGYTLEPNEYRRKEICLINGLYNFTIWDEYGDGEFCIANTIRIVAYPEC